MADNVVTLAAHRGLGLGRRVMRALVEAAWEAGAYKITLTAGRERDVGGFYEALGFSGAEKLAFVLRAPDAERIA